MQVRGPSTGLTTLTRLTHPAIPSPRDESRARGPIVKRASNLQIAQQRTASRPTPNCLAASPCTAFTDGYFCRCSTIKGTACVFDSQETGSAQGSLTLRSA